MFVSCEGAGQALPPSDPGEHRLEARADRHRQWSRQHPDRHRHNSRQPRRRRDRRKGDWASSSSTATTSADCARPTARSYPNAEITVGEGVGVLWLDEGNATGRRSSRTPTSCSARSRRRSRSTETSGTGILAQDTNGHTPGHASTSSSPRARARLSSGGVTAGYAPARRRQSGLAGRRRHGRDAGGNDAAQALRHARRRAHASLGLSLSFPSLGYIDSSPHAGELESGASAQRTSVRQFGPWRDHACDGPGSISPSERREATGTP